MCLSHLLHHRARPSQGEKLEKRFDVGIREVEECVNAPFDQVKTEVRGQMAGVKEDIAELKGSMKILISILQSPCNPKPEIIPCGSAEC